MRALMLVLVVCCLVVLTVASCGKKAEAPESSGAPLATAAAPVGSEEAKPAESAESKPSGSVDEQFHGIIIYPDAAAKETASIAMGGTETKVFEAADTFENVAAFYKDRYAEKASGTDGGIITGSQDDTQTQVITWQEEGATKMITVSKGATDEKVTIGLSYNKPTN